MPDPANDLCVEDIERVQSDIAREGQMLVYAHYNIILLVLMILVRLSTMLKHLFLIVALLLINNASTN